MAVVDGEGLPLGVLVTSASPAEVKLIEETLDQAPQTEDGEDQLQRLVYDKAADSDELREQLDERGIELICPHRSNRVRPATQDGRKLRRYRRRWKVERTFAWIGNYRRLVVRYEWYPRMYVAFVHLACILITLKRL